MDSINRIVVCLYSQTTPDLHLDNSPLSAVATNIKIKLSVWKMKENAVRQVSWSVCQPVNNPIINRETKSENISVRLNKIVTKVKENKDIKFRFIFYWVSLVNC